MLPEARKKLLISYEKKTVGNLSIYDARHAFVTILEHGSVYSSTNGSFFGHGKDQMLKRYARAATDSGGRAMQIIEREVGGGGGERDVKLKLIFEKVRKGKMTFAEFKKAFEDSSAVF